MDRTTTAALVTAAVIGIAGGAVASTVRGADPTAPGHPVASSSPSATPSPSAGSSPTSSPATPTGTETAPVNEPLLYFSADRIHDGDQTIPVPELTEVRSLARIEGGYLLAEPTSSQAADFDLWTVSDAGKSNRLATISGPWDINVGGTRVVALNQQDGTVTVWDLTDGTKVASWGSGGDSVGNVAFAGDQVLISRLYDGQQYQLSRWDPDTDKTVNDRSQGFESMGVSPGGSYIAGAVNSEGNQGKRNSCLALHNSYLRKTTVSWKSCDWSLAKDPVQFSPDGTKLLSVPMGTDGFGPGEFGVIDASDGPSAGVTRVDVPDATLGAEWADNDHLWVYGSLHPDAEDVRQGMWVQRCSLDGRCAEVARSKSEITVGGVF